MIKWVDASKYWPAMDTSNVIVEGCSIIHLKEKYDLCVGHDFAVWVKFYCLIADPLPWSGNLDKNFFLDTAIFYAIDDYCCNGDEQILKSHKKHQEDIGLYYGNIRKYADKSEFKAAMDLISRWSYIDDETEI